MTKFSFKGNIIYVTEERERYNAIRLEYENMANKAKEEFIKRYRYKNENLDDVINNVNDDAASIIVESIKYTVDKLIEKKFYNISEELFIEKYCQDAIAIWESAYSTINDQYLNIVLDEKQKEEYRQLRKDSRSRWQGGGFGFEGAIKGATQAGVMNMATGVAHSAFNMIGKFSTSIKANKQKSMIFNDPSTLDILSEGIYLSVLEIKSSYIKFLEANTDLKFGYVNKQDEEESNVIVSNIKGRNIDNEEKINLIMKLMNLNPYSKSLYMYMIDNFGDENMEISNISSYFGIDMELYKLSLLEDKFIDLDTNTEEDTILAKQIMLQEVKRLGIKSEVDIIEQLDEKLEKFDIEARTVEELLFETREEAEKIKLDKLKIKEIVNNMNDTKEESLLKAKNEIQNIGVTLNSTRQEIRKIDDLLEVIDKNERTVNNILFETREMASRAKKEKLELDKILDSVDLNNKEHINIAISKIELYDFKTIIGKNEINKLNKVLEDIDLESKTVEGILFKTKEEADLAREEQLKIERIMNNLDVKDGDSLINVKKEIESRLFKTEISDLYIDRINNYLRELYSDIIEQADKYEENKRNLKDMLIGSAIILALGLYFFGKVGIILKIIIGVFLLGSIQALLEAYKNLNLSKESIKQVKELKKSGKIL